MPSDHRVEDPGLDGPQDLRDQPKEPEVGRPVAGRPVAVERARASVLISVDTWAGIIGSLWKSSKLNGRDGSFWNEDSATRHLTARRYS